MYPYRKRGFILITTIFYFLLIFLIIDSMFTIISDNIECVSYEDINTGYSYSDHDPVYLKFRLK